MLPTVDLPHWKKRTALFLGGQTASLFGSSLVQYAIIWHITLVSASGWMLMLATLSSFLPQIVISLFAGVWADRFNRRHLIMLSDGLIAFSTLCLAIVFLLGYNEIWMLFVISAVRSVGSGVQMPAVNAFLPQLVPQEKLMRVNGINGTIQSFIMLVSPAASGALLAFAGLEATFFVDVITAAIAIGFMFFIRVHNQPIVSERLSYFNDLKTGIFYMKDTYLIRILAIFSALFFFFIAPAAFLTPLMVVRVFGDDIWRLTAQEMFFSVGAIGGGILIATWGGFKNRIYTLALSGLTFGITTLLLGFSTSFIFFLLVNFIMGFFMPFFNTIITVLLQEKVDSTMQGRVFGLMGLITSMTLPLGMLIFGPLADVIPIQWMLIGTGAVLMVLGIVIAYNKKLRIAAKNTTA